MNISVVMPAYNEEKKIESSLEKLTAYLKGRYENYEILVINDGSKDKTSEIVEKFKENKVRLIENTKNMGKGASVKIGMINAKYDPILFTDADLATPIEELEKFHNALNEGTDIAIASRALEQSHIAVSQPKYRQILGKTFPLLVKQLILNDFKDTQCGFKLFKKEAAMKIFPRQTLKRWAFDVEILFIAKELGYKIKELPVTWEDKGDSKLAPIRDSAKMFQEIVKIKRNALQGKYK
ncbi:glycosyltransferase family 2 protein [Candidatus Woesearchaeota archaeon]|nr:glycosyltransferase family 2 protein [Candidatus Woesearchaeota archaeon]